MKLITKTTIACALVLSMSAVNADTAKSEKHAKKATELRQSVFSLLGSNMGPLGGMAKGKIEFNEKAIKKHARRINQLSHMIADYTRTDTSSFKTKTDALDKVWKQRAEFKKRIKDLNQSSKNLLMVAESGDQSAIKKAIGGVGKTCGGCHDNFKKD